MLKQYQNDKGEYEKYAWPGGYPIFYLCADNGVLCPNCANKNQKLDCADDPQWNVVAADVNWEDDNLFCDNCSKQIKSAYGD